MLPATPTDLLKSVGRELNSSTREMRRLGDKRDARVSIQLHHCKRRVTWSTLSGQRAGDCEPNPLVHPSWKQEFRDFGCTIAHHGLQELIRRYLCECKK